MNGVVKMVEPAFARRLNRLWLGVTTRADLLWRQFLAYVAGTTIQLHFQVLSMAELSPRRGRSGE